MTDEIKYVKLDMDDVLEILLEYFQEKLENGESAKGMFLGTPENDLRFIGAFSSVGNQRLSFIDLETIDKELEYNGDHSVLKSHPNFQIKNNR